MNLFLAEQAWLKDMIALGVQIAHPDDGWVDRKANTIMFAYPSMQRARPAPGVLVALGAPDKWRLVTLTREVRKPLGTPKWAFVESTPAASAPDPARIADEIRRQPPMGTSTWGTLDVAVTTRELRIDDVSGLPCLTFDMSEWGGPGSVTFCLAPDAVRALVDALSGVAPVAPGEVRLTVRADLSALRDGSWVKLSLEPEDDGLNAREREKLARNSL